jgi:N-acetylglucosamine-6-phosphate deacetylase
MKVYAENIYVPQGRIRGTITFSNGVIEKIEENVKDEDALDFGCLRLIPGIFDTHNHGTCGFDPANTCKGDSEAAKNQIRSYLKGLASQGVTSIFPTLVSSDGLRNVASVAEENEVLGAQILGIHSEGPWLNRVGEKGIKTGWPEISVDLAKKMVEDANGWLKLVAIAPEIPGACEVIDYFLSQGIVVAAAHSDNKYKEATEAYNHGVSVATHLGNVMTDIHHRDVGGIGAGLLNDSVTCEMICDGMHNCNEMLRIYLKVKDHDMLEMISDCTPLSGAPEGTYSAYGLTVNVTKDGFVLTDTGRLMGSSQPVLYGIKNLVENLHVPLEECLKMACVNPSKKYGFFDKKGSLEVGKDADFVLVDKDYKVISTYSRGIEVYNREKDGVLFNDSFLETQIK